MLFHKIEDAQAIVVSGGVYKQVDLYRRNGRVYVGTAGGFVRIEGKMSAYHGTSKPSLSVVEIETSPLIKFGRFGEPLSS